MNLISIVQGLDDIIDITICVEQEKGPNLYIFLLSLWMFNLLLFYFFLFFIMRVKEQAPRVPQVSNIIIIVMHGMNAVLRL